MRSWQDAEERHGERESIEREPMHCIGVGDTGRRIEGYTSIYGNNE